MKITTLRLVGFGSAKTLTRDRLNGEFTEVQAYDSLFPPIG